MPSREEWRGLFERAAAGDPADVAEFLTQHRALLLREVDDFSRREEISFVVRLLTEAASKGVLLRLQE